MDPITDGVRGIGQLVRCLDHQPVLGRQAHIIFQDAAEIRCELDGCRKAVVRSGDRGRDERQAFGAQRERPPVGRSGFVALEPK